MEFKLALKLLTYLPKFPLFFIRISFWVLNPSKIPIPIPNSQSHPLIPSIMSDLPPEKSIVPVSSSLSSMPESSSSLHHSYSRKQKSLGLLCTKLVPFYKTHLVSFEFFFCFCEFVLI